jgi:class 3 adenylate cyclase
MFADLTEFSRVTANKSPDAVVELLNRYFSAFDRLADRLGVEKVKTIGDTYVAVAGVPAPRPDHAEAVAELALSMQQAAARIDPGAGTGEPLSLRVGINTGPVVAGVIGTRKYAYDLWGRTVNIASQMESLGLQGSIQVTAATYERLKDKYLFEERGAFYVRDGGEVETYLLRGRRGAAR